MLGRTLGTVAAAAALGCLVSGCSDLSYPAVHDMPAPRADTTLTPDEVKQATDNLLNERDHLSTEAQAATGNPPSQQKPPANVQPVSAQTPAASDTTAPATSYARP